MLWRLLSVTGVGLVRDSCDEGLLYEVDSDTLSSVSVFCDVAEYCIGVRNWHDWK